MAGVTDQQHGTFEGLLDVRSEIDFRFQELSGRIVTLLFADLAGSTEYFEKHGDSAGRARVQRFHDTAVESVHRCGGDVAKTLEDGILAVFDETASAIVAACSLMRRLAESETDVPVDRRPRARIGINTGQATLDAGEPYGDVVNVAARICQEAQPESILLTETTYGSLERRWQMRCRSSAAIELDFRDQTVGVYNLEWHGEEAVRETQTLVLEVALENKGLRLVLSEQDTDGQTILPRRYRQVDTSELKRVSYQTYSTLEAAVHERIDGISALENLRRSGRELYDLLLDTETKSALLSTKAPYLLLKIDDELVEVPWELLYDGEKFFSERFAIGRQMVTEVSAPEPGRMRECRMEPTVMILGSGDDLKTLSDEARGIRRVLAKYPFKTVANLEAGPEDFREALRRAEVLHFSGHAEFKPDTPKQSALVLEDGVRLTVEAIGESLVGAEKVPRLVFLNTCGSGRSPSWEKESAKAAFGLGNMFLLRGVGHVIVTFGDVSDTGSAKIGEAFYHHLGRGATIGESLRRAHEAAQPEDPAGMSYALYGPPRATLQGSGYVAALRSGFESRQLPSGQKLSILDCKRFADYRTRAQTQVLTIVLVELHDLNNMTQTFGERLTVDLLELFRRTVRGCLSEFGQMEEITCSEGMFLIASARPSQAVCFALGVQSRLRSHLLRIVYLTWVFIGSGSRV